MNRLNHSMMEATISYTGVMIHGAGLFWVFVILLCMAATIFPMVEGTVQWDRRQKRIETRYLTSIGAATGNGDAG